MLGGSVGASVRHPQQLGPVRAPLENTLGVSSGVARVTQRTSDSPLQPPVRTT
jgi:hypothetical protein